MTIKYGFYNSRYHDKVYDAENFAAIFDGIINDGVFMNVGEHFTVAPSTDLKVSVGPGRAWFNSTWTASDTNFIVSFDRSDAIDKRIDAVVLDINNQQRVNSIKVVKGTPSSDNVRPALARTDKHNQYALAYVTIRANATSVTIGDIQNVVGLDETPYVSGILKTANVTDLYSNWEEQFNTWFERVQSEFEAELLGFENMTWPIPKATKDYIGLDPSTNTLRDVLKNNQDQHVFDTNHLAEIDSSIGTLKAKDIQLSSDIADLNNSITNFNSSVADVKSGLDEVSGRATELEAETAELTSSVAELRTASEDHDNKIDQLQTDKNALYGLVDDLRSDVDANSEDIDNIKDDINNLQTTTGSANSDITKLKTDVSALQTGLSTTNANLSSANSNIGSLQTNLNTANNDIDSLENRMATAEQNISNLSAASGSGVTSFNGRTGSVTPQNGDYTAAQVGAVPTTGGTFSGAVTFGGGLKLTSASPQDTNMPYFLGINAFASGGIVRWVAANGVPEAIGAATKAYVDAAVEPAITNTPFYASDLFLYMTGRHPYLNAGPYSDNTGV